MTQLNEEQNTQEITSSDDNSPAEQENTFIEIGNQKVQLDIEDAPFLNDAEDELPAVVAEDDETAVATIAEDGEEQPKSKKKLIIIVGAALILLIALAVGAFLFLGGEEEEVVIPKNVITIPAPPADDVSVSYQIKLDPFWIDLENDVSGATFLVGTFIIAVEARSIQDEINTNLKVVRDAIYYYLAGTGAEFLMDMNNAEKIRNGINEILSQYVMSGPITDIYFDSFLMK